MSEDVILRWRREPWNFVRQAFDEPVTPDGWQDETLEAVADPTKTHYALRANKGPGKTAVLSWIILWFLFCFPDSNIVATAITGENLRDNLWKELALWLSKSKLLSATFNWQKERVHAKDPRHEAQWWCSARKWSKDADPQQQANTLAGLHAKYVMAIVDEAGGVPEGVVQAAEGILANQEVDGGIGKVIISGNPTHVEGPLYRAFELEPDMWWRLHLTADPLFLAKKGKRPLKYTKGKDASITRFTNRVSQKYVENLIRRYGRNSPVVLVNAFGEFPMGVSDAIVTIQQFRDAMTAYHPPRKDDFPRILGVDVARLGSNETVVAHRIGNTMEKFESWIGRRTTVTADRVADIFRRGKYEQIRIDDVGSGGGVTDILMREGLPVMPIDVGSTERMLEDEKTKHLNLRSILYHDLQDLFAESGIAVNPAIEADTTLIEEGTTLQIQWTERNKRKIEAKANYKKRTGRSPDYLDAMMLAFADRIGSPGVGSFVSAPEPEEVEDERVLLPIYRRSRRLLDRRKRHVLRNPMAR